MNKSGLLICASLFISLVLLSLLFVGGTGDEEAPNIIAVLISAVALSVPIGMLLLLLSSLFVRSEKGSE